MGWLTVWACGLLIATGCPGAPPQIVPPAEDAFGQRGRGGAGPAGSDDAIDGGSRLVSGLFGTARKPKLLALGAECYDRTECVSGACEGHGCGLSDSGVCVAADRPCKGTSAEFCGCDGDTFSAPVDCPGQVYRFEGACPSADAGPPEPAELLEAE